MTKQETAIVVLNLKDIIEKIENGGFDPIKMWLDYGEYFEHTSEGMVDNRIPKTQVLSIEFNYNPKNSPKSQREIYNILYNEKLMLATEELKAYVSHSLPKGVACLELGDKDILEAQRVATQYAVRNTERTWREQYD